MHVDSHAVAVAVVLTTRVAVSITLNRLSKEKTRGSVGVKIIKCSNRKTKLAAVVTRNFLKIRAQVKMAAKTVS